MLRVSEASRSDRDVISTAIPSTLARRALGHAARLKARVVSVFRRDLRRIFGLAVRATGLRQSPGSAHSCAAASATTVTASASPTATPAIAAAPAIAAPTRAAACSHSSTGSGSAACSRPSTGSGSQRDVDPVTRFGWASGEARVERGACLVLREALHRLCATLRLDACVTLRGRVFDARLPEVARAPGLGCQRPIAAAHGVAFERLARARGNANPDDESKRANRGGEHGAAQGTRRAARVPPKRKPCVRPTDLTPQRGSLIAAYMRARTSRATSGGIGVLCKAAGSTKTSFGAWYASSTRR